MMRPARRTGEPAVVLPSFIVYGFTDLQLGLAWFKLTFGCFFLVIAVGFIARFYQVRNVFEIKARSPYLVMLGGLSLLGMVGLPAYMGAAMLDHTVPINIYAVFISFYFFVFSFFVSFWGRIIRLGLAYCPRYKRRLPWLMSERLLVCVSILAGLASMTMPLCKMCSITGPFAELKFATDQKDQLVLCQVVLLIATVLFIPIVWHVDDLFKIRTELFVATVLQIIQTAGNATVNKYGTEKASHWINQENTVFLAGIIMFSITVLDPLRRLAFEPMFKSNRTFARAHAQRKRRGLRVSKKRPLSEVTEPDSQLDSQYSQSASASELGTPTTRSRRKWSYENLAAVPGMASAFRAFAFRALCEESVVFLEEVSRYENGDFSRNLPETQSQKEAFSAIVARFIVDGSVDEVNISWADKKQILELNRSGAQGFDMLDDEQKRTVFGDAYTEIRVVLETNLLQRFTETQGFVDEEQRGSPSAQSRRHRSSSSSGSGVASSTTIPVSLFGSSGNGNMFGISGALGSSNSSSSGGGGSRNDAARAQGQTVDMA